MGNSSSNIISNIINISSRENGCISGSRSSSSCNCFCIGGSSSSSGGGGGGGGSSRCNLNIQKTVFNKFILHLG